MLTEEQKLAHAQEISQTRILTQDDFKKLKSIQEKKRRAFARGGTKRKAEDDSVNLDDSDIGRATGYV